MKMLSQLNYWDTMDRMFRELYFYFDTDWILHKFDMWACWFCHTSHLMTIEIHWELDDFLEMRCLNCGTITLD